jgi:hypothetical protein
MSDAGIGQTEALAAVVKASESDPPETRVSASTLRLIIDIAWHNQYETENRSQVRRMLAESLGGEIARVERRFRDAAS